MIDELVAKLRAEVAQARALSEHKRAELLKHLEAVEGSADQAGSGKDHPLKGLVNSIEGLETSHPKITELVNRIATFLGNLGI